MERLTATLVALNVTNQECRAPEPRLKFIKHLEVLRDELRLEHQILRRITGNRKLWRQDQFGAGISESLVGAKNFFEVAAQIPDRRIYLSETDLHTAPGKLCAGLPSAIAFGFPCAVLQL